MLERTINVAGARLFLTLHGQESLPPLLLLHGGMGSSTDFEALIPLLSDHFYVMALDSRGHGRSTFGTEPLSYRRLELDALATLDELRIRSAHVLGFSDGGIAALRLAAHHPSRINTLFTIGTDWMLPEENRNFLNQVTPDWWRNRHPHGPYSETTYLATNPDTDFERLVTENVTMWVDTTTTSGYPSDEVKKITAPLTIIRGAADPLSNHELAATLQGMLPGAKLVELPDVGHEVAATQPTAVANLIRAVRQPISQHVRRSPTQKDPQPGS